MIIAVFSPLMAPLPKRFKPQIPSSWENLKLPPIAKA